MENIPKISSESDNNSKINYQKEEKSTIFNNIIKDINKKEKEKNESIINDSGINISSNNSNTNGELYKPKDNIINFQTTYPLLFK